MSAVQKDVDAVLRLEADALARGEAPAVLIFTSNRQFPRGRSGTTGRLVEALQSLLLESPTLRRSLFLKG